MCLRSSSRLSPRSTCSLLFSFVAVFIDASPSGNVGLSLGWPTSDTSLSGQFTTFGKFVMCFTMIRGRHRGLPYAVDRSIMLPGDIDEDISEMVGEREASRAGQQQDRS